MFTDNLAFRGFDFARLSREIARQEVAEFALTDKADAGRIFLFRGDKVELFGNAAHFRFFQLANREQTLGDLLVAKGIEEVALIFVAIQTAQQLALASHVLTTHVVTGGDKICAEIFSRELQERFEFDLFVAEDIGVGRATRFVLFEEMLKDVIPVFSGKVNFVQLHTQLVAHRLRIRQIVRGGTILLAIVLLPVLHEQAFNLVTLLLQ